MTIVDFYEYDHGFCESTIYENIYQPEFINSVSSLCITFVGIFGLIYNSRYQPNISMVYNTFIINGICSCMYHYTHYIGWGLADRFSMILMVVYCYNICIQYLNMNNLIKIICISFIVSLLTVTGLNNETLFNILFGVFLISIIVCINMARLSLTYQRYALGKKGIQYIVLAGVLWIITEMFCNHIWIMKYMVGHAFWHIGVSIGGYYITLTFAGEQNMYMKYKFGLPYICDIPYIPNNKFEV